MKSQSGTKKEQEKEPNKSINLAFTQSKILKSLKNFKNIKRDALLERYYMKCESAHADKFFVWREKFAKLRLTQKIVITSAINHEYGRQNPDWISTRIYKLSEVKVPPQLSLTQEQVQHFNKIISIIYPPNTIPKPPPPLTSVAQQ